MHLHSLHFLWELAALAHACGCCALAAGWTYDEGLYTVGLVSCTLAVHLHRHCKGIECCLALDGLCLFSMRPSGFAHLWLEPQLNSLGVVEHHPGCL